MKTTTKLFADLEAQYLSSVLRQKAEEQFESSDTTLIAATNVIDAVINKKIVLICHGTESKYVFQGSSDTLRSVTFESGSQLTTIGRYSFYCCTHLESVNLTQCTKLTEIHNLAFAFCYSLRSFNLPLTIELIGDNVFRCDPIEETFNLSNIQSLSENSFTNTSLSFTCSSSNTLLSEYENNIYSKKFSVLRLVSFSTTFLKIHPNTTTILNTAFSSCSLEEIILPQQITTLRQYSFHMNAHIKKLVLSGSVKTIQTEKVICSALPNLEILHFPEGVESIKSKFIELCPKLKIIHIPNSLREVSDNAFDVPSLKFVTYSRWQYRVLLSGGVPRRALLHIHSQCSSMHSIVFLHISLLFFISF